MSLLKIRMSNAFSAASVVCIITMAGCARQEILPTELVEGVVTLDGQPVPDATITFVPVQEGAGATATGMTDSTGKYHLTAIGAGIGANAEADAGTLPGEYYVGVIKDNLPNAPEVGDPNYAEPSEEPQPPKEAAITHAVPEKFNHPQTSGIKVTVKAGKNEIPVDLKST